MIDAIYHNPRCSKSRQTLALLQSRGVKLQIIDYLQTPPEVACLAEICTALGKRPLEITRRGESLFSELGLSADDDRSDSQWLELLHQHPRLIERPIVVFKGRAALGRPPESVLDILD